jgi:hypothetical protein
MIGKALDHDGPALVEVQVARQELAMPPTITLDQAAGSPSMHDGSIAIRVTLKTFTPLRDRLGDCRERGVGLFDRLTVVADDAPAPVRVTGGRDSKHVHVNDLDANQLGCAKCGWVKPDAKGSDACCVCQRPGGRRFQGYTLTN